MTSPWRVVFFGTPSFSLPSLQSLMRSREEIVAVVTQPDREKGRGRRMAPSPVKDWSMVHRLNVLQPEKVKEEAFQDDLQRLGPDLFVVVAYGQLLPASLLRIPKFGAVNVHASLLPKYRGAAPIAWAILKGEEVTGVTTMKMDEGMDSGDILLQKAIPIEKEETGEALHDKLASLGAQLLVDTLGKMKRGEISPIPQDHAKATYAPLIKKEDGRIDWQREAWKIDRQVRAFSPWPVAFTLLENRLLKIYQGEVRESKPKALPGTVRWVGSDFIEVETGKGSYLIKEVQLEGKRRMGIRDFLSGHPISVGTLFL